MYGPGSCPRVVDEGLASMWGTCCGIQIGAFSVRQGANGANMNRPKKSWSNALSYAPLFTFIRGTMIRVRGIQPFEVQDAKIAPYCLLPHLKNFWTSLLKFLPKSIALICSDSRNPLKTCHDVIRCETAATRGRPSLKFQPNGTPFWAPPLGLWVPTA